MKLHYLGQKKIISIVDQFMNKIPIIYSDNSSMNVVTLLKRAICENKNLLCYHNDLPELNHNE